MDNKEKILQATIQAFNQKGLKFTIEDDDKIYVTNRLLEVFEKIGLDTDSDVINGNVDSKKHTTRRISEILSDCLKTAINDGLIEDTQLNRDILQT